jgi:hypothetical protein
MSIYPCEMARGMYLLVKCFPDSVRILANAKNDSSSLRTCPYWTPYTTRKNELELTRSCARDRRRVHTSLRLPTYSFAQTATKG